MLQARGWKEASESASIEDVIRFIESPDLETVLGKRDRAILELLYGAGIRVNELTGLNLDDVDYKNQSIRVRGKAAKNASSLRFESKRGS